MWFGSSDKRDEKKESDMYATSFSAAQKSSDTPAARPASAPSAGQSREAAVRRVEQAPSFAGGIPAHLDDNQKIIVGSTRRGSGGRTSNDVLKREETSIFMEKMASIVGPSYVIALISGGAYGMTMVPPPKARRTTRILMNTYLNNIGKTSSRFANNTAAAMLLFVLTGKFINFIFLEELEDFKLSSTMQHAVYGGAAGALYKSTRGFRPMILSAVLGASLGSAYAYAWQKGYFDLVSSRGANAHVGQRA